MNIRKGILALLLSCCVSQKAVAALPELVASEPAGADGNYELSWSYFRGGLNQSTKHVLQEFGFYKKVGTTKQRFPVHVGSLGFNANVTGTDKVFFPNRLSDFDGYYIITKWSGLDPALMYYDVEVNAAGQSYENLSFDKSLKDTFTTITLVAPSAALADELASPAWQKWYPRYGGLDNVPKVFLSFTKIRKLGQCENKKDDDGDGLIDVADPICVAGSQTEFEQCRDGIDNDGDGVSDKDDPGCWTNVSSASTYSAALNDEGRATTQCQDKFDNDNDGAADFPADFSCASKLDHNESDPAAQCQNRTDDDSDGLIDLADPGCSGTQDNNEADATSQCQDKIDNDGDGLVDAADPGCADPKDNNEGDGTSQCQDGIDNDKDGAVDGADFSCGGDKLRNDETNPKAACQDGLDNDADGVIDLKDFGCRDAQDNNEGDEAVALRAGLECVRNNQDGSYTAYLTYENVTGKPLEVVTDAAKGTRNDVVPAPILATGNKVFEPGLKKGAVAVVFDGAQLTWTVRPAGSAGAVVTASKSSPECKKVEPRAECIDGSKEGLKVTFGYTNNNGFPIMIPTGAQNGFKPDPADRGQPKQFAAGLNAAAFTATFSDTLLWSLDGLSATASNATPICPGGCVEKPVGTLKAELNKTALDLADVTKQAADALAKRAMRASKQGKLSKAQAIRIGVDAKRAAKKANALAKEAEALTLQVPGVIRTCPVTPPLCQSVDRQSTIEALRALYAKQLNQLKRIMARRNFTMTGGTDRNDALVNEGKALKAQGDEQLKLLPRIATECA